MFLILEFRLQENKYKEAIGFYEPIVKKHYDNVSLQRQYFFTFGIMEIFNRRLFQVLREHHFLKGLGSIGLK